MLGSIEVGDISYSQPTDPTFNILCEVPDLTRTFTTRLERQGFCFDPDAPVKLIIDVQKGFALRSLETLRATDSHVIVVTFSFCPEYWEDLWDLRPQILIVDEGYEHDYADTIVRATAGQRYRVTPKSTTPLNPIERHILQLLARGYSNKDIAQHLHLQDQTVMNMLTAIYQKINVKNRMGAVLYYWGISAMFNRSPDPTALRLDR